MKTREEILSKLKETRDSLEDWSEYTSMYFKEKHGLYQELQDLDTFIREAEKNGDNGTA